MIEFDLWVHSNRKVRHYCVIVEDDEIVESVRLEGENVSLIALLQKETER